MLRQDKRFKHVPGGEFSRRARRGQVKSRVPFQQKRIVVLEFDDVFTRQLNSEIIGVQLKGSGKLFARRWHFAFESV
jgi:hypothetical protein